MRIIRKIDLKVDKLNARENVFDILTGVNSLWRSAGVADDVLAEFRFIRVRFPLELARQSEANQAAKTREGTNLEYFHISGIST